MSRPDIEWIARLREKADSNEAVAIVRDRSYWGHLLSRASMPTLWLGPETWESRLMIVEDTGYLWSSFVCRPGGRSARILEAAERKPDAALPALLEELFAVCRDRKVKRVETWTTLDPAVSSPVEASPGAAVPMWKPLDPEIAPVLARLETAAAFHLTDVF